MVAGRLSVGRSAYALVVLPGLDGTGALHSAFARAVEADFSSVTVIPYPADMPLDYAQIELRVRSLLPADTRFVLLGESFSGPVAISIAAAPPANLAGLVLSTTFATAPLPLSAAMSAVVRFAPVRAATPALLSWWLLGRWSTHPLKVSLQEALHRVAPAVLRHRASTALGANVLHKLAQIRVPVLCLRAARDRLLAKDCAERIAAGIERCDLVDIDGPHLLLQAVPEDCARAVGRYAASLS